MVSSIASANDTNTFSPLVTLPKNVLPVFCIATTPVSGLTAATFADFNVILGLI